jgi:hypothetical protein
MSFPQPTIGGRHAAEQRAAALDLENLIDRRRRPANKRRPAMTHEIGSCLFRHRLFMTDQSPDARRVIAPGALSFSDGLWIGAAISLLLCAPELLQVMG